MFDIAIIAICFGLVFVAELPDKTAIASLVLGTKYPLKWVFTGVAAAFFVHVCIAVAAGSLVAQLPQRAIEGVVGTLFLIGAILLWRNGAGEEEEEDEVKDLDNAGFWKVAGLGFSIIFVAEFGDLTQILTANLAAKYNNPLSVGIGAVLGLWAVGLLGLLGGKTLLKVIPIKLIVRIASAIMVCLAAYSIYSAITG